MREFYIKVKTLTYIWTGDKNGEFTTLRETGIIGSLRWWYEALIRGLNGYACDPTDAGSRCKLDGEKFKKSINSGKSVQEALDEQICPVCQLFGCTGWARKFRLEVEFNTTMTPKVRIKTRNKHLKRNAAGFIADGTIILKFIPIRKISSNEWALLNKILEIIANYGGLGAKLSQGNGVVKIVENNLPCGDKKLKSTVLKKENDTKENDTIPNLNDFFFYKFHIKFKEGISNLINNKVFWDLNDSNCRNWEKLWDNYHLLPIAFHIRDAIRHLENDKNKRHKIFGELGKGSKVFVSHGYRIRGQTVETRIWGYGVKESIKNKIKRELENKLKEKLFSKEEYKESLESCTLVEKKTGKEILEELI